MKRLIVALLVSLLAWPGAATGAEMLRPRNKQVFRAQLAFGMITTPERITFVVRLEKGETSPQIWVDRSPRFGPSGLPLGHRGGGWFCDSDDFRKTKSNEYTCSIATFPWLDLGTWWWTLSFDRASGTRHAKRPSSFSLTAYKA